MDGPSLLGSEKKPDVYDLAVADGDQGDVSDAWIYDR